MPTQSLDLTGSLYNFWNNLIPDNVSSLANATGSSVIDRALESIMSLPVTFIAPPMAGGLVTRVGMAFLPCHSWSGGGVATRSRDTR